MEVPITLFNIPVSKSIQELLVSLLCSAYERNDLIMTIKNEIVGTFRDQECVPTENDRQSPESPGIREFNLRKDLGWSLE